MTSKEDTEDNRYHRQRIHAICLLWAKSLASPKFPLTMPTHQSASTVDLAPNALRRKLLFIALQAPEFRASLREAAEEIRNAAKPDVTEATIEGYFERVVYALLREIGLTFHPDKESAVEVNRHLMRGRTDSRLGALVIEYKRPSLLRTEDQTRRAVRQLESYLVALSGKTETPFTGILTNGLVVVEVTALSGKIIAGPSHAAALDDASLLRLTQHVISLALTALTPVNLIRDFCGSGTDGVLFETARLLYKALASNPQPKTAMLKSEWEVLFRLAHDDASQQKRIQDRKQAIGELFAVETPDSETEYRMLFALHTAYAITLKFLAYRVVSDVYFGRVAQDFRSLASSTPEALREFCAHLEDGDLFRSLGILNLLEGDFFSWYSDEQQWTRALAAAIQQIVVILARYEEAKHIFNSDEAQDLFRDLYQAAVPKAVRSSFGEVYTPYWLAEHVLEAASPPDDWRALDPCCGSGTFVIAAIARLRRESSGATADTILEDILSRVTAIDLHPLAVLTTRINYFIHISSFLEQNHEEFVIPVYLGDASSIPRRSVVDGVECLHHHLKTLKAPIDCTLPVSMVSDTRAFVKLMYNYELCIQDQNRKAAAELLTAAVPAADRVAGVIAAIARLTDNLVELEEKGWNGIWARILSNFFTTACLGRFTVVMGNPPWIDWKNLPHGYRERIKADVVDPKLFSGAGRTGGINLNICALIAYVSMVNWLDDNGRAAFLMPRELINQASYEGWRRLGEKGWKFLAFDDWTSAGHPFDPVREDFMTFVMGKRSVDSSLVPVRCMERQRGTPSASSWKNVREALQHLDVAPKVAGQIIPGSTAFTVADDLRELREFALVAGECAYVGREGIEFYPQELLLFTYDAEGPRPGTVWLNNVQVRKSKYKVPKRRTLLETKFLHPLVKGPAIVPFGHEYDGLIVAFPYEESDPHRPIPAERLKTESPLLFKYYNTHKSLMDAQTKFSDKIRGPDPGEFYGLARTGPYSFADTYVAFRDNTRWCAAVVTSTRMPWNGKKRFLFQNHAVSMCERGDGGGLIGVDEAHYVCAILNSKVVERFILASSDERSYKIRPPVFVPTFDPTDRNHKALVEASKTAHEHPEQAPALRDRMTQAYLHICKRAQASSAMRSKITYSAEFQRALGRLESHGITTVHAAEARSHWSFIAQTHPLREPIVQITPDGAVQFAWNRDHYYLEVEVYPNGRLAWFFRDRHKDEADGTEGEPTSELPEKFWRILTRENVAT